ncbi:shikimate dehydrogenase [Haloactinopolyspora alba]|uniref:Shikimate dehydrogenase n=1 Tax=Haloactinopolyspora alba TaxID=648780 RepID=A0A2P8DXY2_9ACTN|nr:shikimate dehydrogenase [Haloactinopolyspora alba]PSL02062.1 shikimate dehydrogenase [Haloactinopolyspora alba]
MSTPDPERRCAVLGSPIAHSLSPAIHRAAYRHLCLAWRYTAHEVDETALAGFLAGLGPDWLGLSLTMPLKRVALELSDDASDVARAVGAANTLIRDDDGRWTAANTDVPGIVDTVTEAGGDVAAPVCVWGGGATAASVLAALALMDAGPAHVHARSAERAGPALAVAAALGHPAEPVSWTVGPSCRDAAVTISTAPAGAVDDLADTLAEGASGRLLFDVVYDPWPTTAAAAWMAAGGTVASGLDLLVHQAVGQLRLMTGADVPVAVLRSAAHAAIGART